MGTLSTVFFIAFKRMGVFRKPDTIDCAEIDLDATLPRGGPEGLRPCMASAICSPVMQPANTQLAVRARPAVRSLGVNEPQPRMST